MRKVEEGGVRGKIDIQPAKVHTIYLKFGIIGIMKRVAGRDNAHTLPYNIF